MGSYCPQNHLATLYTPSQPLLCTPSHNHYSVHPLTTTRLLCTTTWLLHTTTWLAIYTPSQPLSYSVQPLSYSVQPLGYSVQPLGYSVHPSQPLGCRAFLGHVSACWDQSDLCGSQGVDVCTMPLAMQVQLGHMVQHMAKATIVLWATWFSRWQQLQYYCGPQGSAEGNGYSITVGHMVQQRATATVFAVDHMVQQRATATVLLWATWFSRGQQLQYYCGPHGSADGNSYSICCGPRGSADGNGNSILWATWFSRWQVLLWATGFSRWQQQQYSVGHMV